MSDMVGPQGQSPSTTMRTGLRLLALLSLGLGLQSATQYYAHTLHYAPILGAHVQHLYAPWGIVNWYAQSQDPTHTLWFTAANLGMVIAASGLLLTMFLLLIDTHTAKAHTALHGSARWAAQDDIQQAGLLGQDSGVYVGAWQDKSGTVHYLRHNGPEHILTYAPTRSGKGVGLVVPTLLSWPHSTVVTDLKGELWALTAGWRQRYAHNKVIRFEPAMAESSASWNPLDEIRLGTEFEVGDVQNLATLIVDPDGKGLESHWQKTAQALLVGVILHVLYKAQNDHSAASLPAVDAILADSTRPIAQLWTEMKQYKHGDDQTHPVVGSAAQDMLDRPEEEAGSVLSTTKSYLALYRDPIVARNVSCSEFRIKDLMNHDDPVSLYIVTQPNDKARLRPLIRVLLNMIVRLLADKMEFERVMAVRPWWQRALKTIGISTGSSSTVRAKKSYKHRLLGMIDEFPSLGKLDIIQESLAFVAGYGLKFYLICQDLNQLKSRETGYGPDETITSNCHVQNAYPPNRVETAEHLSKLTGQTTIIKEQITTSGKRISTLLTQVSRALQEVQRPLLTVDECLRMPGPKKDSDGQIIKAGDMVVYVAGYPAIYGKQPLYFQDPIFIARAAIPEPPVSDKLRTVTALTAHERITL